MCNFEAEFVDCTSILNTDVHMSEDEGQEHVLP